MVFLLNGLKGCVCNFARPAPMSRESRQGTGLPEGDRPACSSSRKAGIPAGRARVQCLTGGGRSPPLFLFLKVREVPRRGVEHLRVMEGTRLFVAARLGVARKLDRHGLSFMRPPPGRPPVSVAS